MTTPDWRLLETFVRVAKAGTLTEGARVLGVSQPTASRHIQALEDELGVTLFVRHARGLHLSDRGAELLEVAQELDSRVQLLMLRATGLRQQPRGTVRITAAEPVGAYVLGPCLAALRHDYPDIALEVVLDNQLANLSRREADIAVRMLRPTQQDLVATRIGDVHVGFFASDSYLQRHGVPRSLDDLPHHTFIGFDRDPFWARQLAQFGLSPAQFRYRTDSIVAQVQALIDGVGVAGTHLQIAARYPHLQRVLSDLPLPALDMWLVMHRDVRDSPAVRVAFNAIQIGLRQYVAEGAALLG